MNNIIKQKVELEKLFNEATSSTLYQADIQKFGKISNLLNSQKQLSKEFIRLIKSNLSGRKHPKSQLLVLELIEFTTCKCTNALHNEYNSKSFLKIINTIFNSINLASNVKEKTLSLILFWEKFFENKKDIFGNFNWYYKNIKKRDIPFPTYVPSPYSTSQYNPQKNTKFFNNNNNQNNFIEQNSNNNQNNNNNQKNFNNYQNNNNNNNEINKDNLTPRQLKLFNDLEVVVENIDVANSLISSKDRGMSQELVNRLKQMEQRLLKLPDNLMNCGEDFLYSYTMALLEDINITKNRYMTMKNGRNPDNFVSRRYQVIIDYNQSQNVDKFDNLQNEYGISSEKKIDPFDGNAQQQEGGADLLDLDVNNNQSNQNHPQPQGEQFDFGNQNQQQGQGEVYDNFPKQDQNQQGGFDNFGNQGQQQGGQQYDFGNQGQQQGGQQNNFGNENQQQGGQEGFGNSNNYYTPESNIKYSDKHKPNIPNYNDPDNQVNDPFAQIDYSNMINPNKNQNDNDNQGGNNQNNNQGGDQFDFGNQGGNNQNNNQGGGDQFDFGNQGGNNQNNNNQGGDQFDFGNQGGNQNNNNQGGNQFDDFGNQNNNQGGDQFDFANQGNNQNNNNQSFGNQGNKQEGNQGKNNQGGNQFDFDNFGQNQKTDNKKNNQDDVFLF